MLRSRARWRSAGRAYRRCARARSRPPRPWPRWASPTRFARAPLTRREDARGTFSNLKAKICERASFFEKTDARVLPFAELDIIHAGVVVGVVVCFPKKNKLCAFEKILLDTHMAKIRISWKDTYLMEKIHILWQAPREAARGALGRGPSRARHGHPRRARLERVMWQNALCVLKESAGRF